MHRYNSLYLFLYILVVESCNDDEFQCSDGGCVSLAVICDNEFNCHDGSDETNCTVVQPCPEGLYRCKSGNCVFNYSECFTPQPEVNLSSSLTRHFPTLFITAQSSSHHNILFRTMSTSRDNTIHSYTTLTDKQLSGTHEQVGFSYTSTVKDIKIETTSSFLDKSSDTSDYGVETVLTTKIVKQFNKETSSNIVILKSTESKSDFSASSYILSTFYSQSSLELEREKYMSHNTWRQFSLQTRSMSYIMGLSYDYSQFDSSIDDETKIYRPTALSNSHLYLLYSSLNMKHSKKTLTKMISRKTEIFKTFFQNMSAPQTIAKKSEHFSSLNAILQLSNQPASTDTFSETTLNSSTMASNIELTQLTSSIVPSTLKTSTSITFSTEKPAVMGNVPHENYYKIIIWCTGILVMYLLTAVWGKMFVDNCRKYKRQEKQGNEIND